ncbi:MAG: molybdate ABC transporter substrate-binding protein [Aureispira sp.]|nr:molybdate ABC transporter substrate-binding protein [Aureispira sp.]
MIRFLCFYTLLITIACNPSKTNKTITVATAASTQYALDELIQLFQEKNDITVHKLVSSSGKLTAQIENGAPIDIFISADMKYPNNLADKGFSIGSPTIYAKGQLAIWMMQDSFEKSSVNKILSNPSLNKIAIADPTTAPYGVLSLNSLKELGVYELLKTKLVFGESIAQVNQYVMTESVEIGLTALSVVMAPQIKNKGKFIAIPNAELEQGMVLIKESEESKKFYQFLQSDIAKNVFQKYGYKI